MNHTPVYIICSPRPLVGKTLTARLLSEFLLLKNGTVTSFDINLKEPSLLDYLPKITETADVDNTYGKMQLMDRLIIDDGVPKVIDLGLRLEDDVVALPAVLELIGETPLAPEVDRAGLCALGLDQLGVAGDGRPDRLLIQFRVEDDHDLVRPHGPTSFGPWTRPTGDRPTPAEPERRAQE